MEKKMLRSIMWIITYAVLLILFILKFDEVRSWFGALMLTLRPLFIGFAISFVLQRPMGFFYRNYFRLLKKEGPARTLAIVSAYLALVLVIVGFFSIVVPRLVESILLFVSSMKGYAENAQVWVNELLGRLNMEEIKLNLSSLSDLLKSALTATANTLNTALSGVLAFTGGVISVVVTTFLSIIFSVYLLSGREKILSQLRRVLRAYAPKKAADIISDVAALTGNTFSAYVTTQLMQATIEGGLCALGVLFIHPDYAPLIGMITAGAALIPMVGAMIGGTLSTVLLFMVSPWKAAIFLMFDLALQQFTGNVVYPRLVGESLGLPSLWVLTAITIGGSMFGFVGVLVSVPMASVLYTMVKRDVNRRLGE